MARWEPGARKGRFYPMPDTPGPAYLRLREVAARTSLSQSSIYRGMSVGTFPKCRQLAPNTVAWLTVEIDEWVASRPTAATPATGPAGCTTSKHSRRKRVPAEAAAAAPA